MRALFHYCAGCVAALAVVSGCQVFQDDQATAQGRSLLRPATPSPDSVAMEIVWARFPAGDPQLNEAAWQSIDETSIAPEVQRELAANGFRAGVITGALPSPLAKALHQGEAAPAQPAIGAPQSLESLLVEPTVRGRLKRVRRGEPVEILASEIHPSLPLLTGRGDELTGKPYHDAQAIYALEVDPQADRTVIVQLTPALHHGAPQPRWSQGDPGVMRLAQTRDHEVFDRLRLNVKLGPGEMLVLMSRPDSGSLLGQYFHTLDTADGQQQRLILIRLAEVPPSDTFATVAGN